MRYPAPAGTMIAFEGVAGKDVYNITAPFKTRFQGKDVEVLAGRVEGRDSERSKILFFVRSSKDGKIWIPLRGAPEFKLQDPFFTKIGDDLVFGGVELVEKDGKINSYYTSFYRGNSLESLRHFADGPQGMKDIRPVALPNGKIGVFTRPQGQKGGRGKIGYTEIANLSELNAKTIEAAPLLENLAAAFGSEVWGGVNAAYPLANGKIGVLAHVAYWTGEGTQAAERHYYSAVFLFDPASRRASNMRVVATRQMLPAGSAKRSDLRDILFSGGYADGVLYGGAGDTQGFSLPLDDIFAGLEIK